MQKLLSDNSSQNIKITNAKLDSKYLLNREYERYTIIKGIVSGRLSGSSLILINALIGTPEELDYTNALVFIEDIDEDLYRSD